MSFIGIYWEFIGNFMRIFIEILIAISQRQFE